jgi:protein O-mannosyl-transferase
MTSRVMRPWLPFGVVTIACFVVYGASIGSGAFQYDDLHAIVGNTQLHSLTAIGSYFTDPGAFSKLSFGGMFRPLVLTSYALTNALAGESPAAYHFGNVVIHAMVAGLLTILLLQQGGGWVAAALGGVWFVAHPVNSEVAAYVSSRAESMSTLLLLLSVHLWIGGPAERVRDGRLVGSVLLFALSLLSKSVGIVLPALLLVHDLVHGRVPWKDRTWWQTASWRHGPFFLVAGLYLFYVSDHLGRALLADPVRPLASQVFTQTKALIYYLRLLVMPRGLSVEHAFGVSDSMWETVVVVSLCTLVSGGLVAIWAALGSQSAASVSISSGSSSGSSSGNTSIRPSRQAPAIFWLVWMPVVLLPTLIVPLNVLVNEHRLYPVTIAVAVLLLRLRQPRSWGAPAMMLVCLCFGVMSFQRSQLWGDAFALWSDAHDKAPSMPRPLLFIGDGHFHAGRYDEALAAYSDAELVQPQQLTPGDRLALHNNRGATLLALGRTAEARLSYAEALRIVPDYAPSVEALAGLQVLADATARDSAAEFLARRGLAAMVSGDLSAAEEALLASLAAQHDDRTSLALGLVFERQKKWQDAAQLYGSLIRSATSTTVVTSARRRLASLTGEIAP